jgi:ribosomal protein S18 acetylase RimI-like enzyme
MMVDGLDSRLSDLGPWFVKLLHRHMIVSEHCLYIVAERNGAIVGYVAALTSTRKFYKTFLARKGLHCFLIVMPWMLRARNIHTALRGLFYSQRAPAEDPEAELVSLVVSPKAWNCGIGSTLFHRVVTEFSALGIHTFKIDTSTENEQANAFYKKHGCQCIRSESFYRNTRINVYLHEDSSVGSSLA